MLFHNALSGTFSVQWSRYLFGKNYTLYNQSDENIYTLTHFGHYLSYAASIHFYEHLEHRWCKIVCFMKISVHIWYSKKYQAYIQSIEKIAQPWNISLWFHAPLKWGSGTWQRGKGVLMCFVQESPLYSQPLPGRSCNFNSMVNDCINRKYKF